MGPVIRVTWLEVFTYLWFGVYSPIPDLLACKQPTLYAPTAADWTPPLWLSS